MLESHVSRRINEASVRLNFIKSFLSLNQLQSIKMEKLTLFLFVVLFVIELALAQVPQMPQMGNDKGGPGGEYLQNFASNPLAVIFGYQQDLSFSIKTLCRHIQVTGAWVEVSTLVSAEEVGQKSFRQFIKYLTAIISFPSWRRCWRPIDSRIRYTPLLIWEINKKTTIKRAL